MRIGYTGVKVIAATVGIDTDDQCSSSHTRTPMRLKVINELTKTHDFVESSRIGMTT
jgi:hypothetical protein